MHIGSVVEHEGTKRARSEKGESKFSFNVEIWLVISGIFREQIYTINMSLLEK